MIKAIFTDFDGVIRMWQNQPIFDLESAFGLASGTLFGIAFASERLLPTITGKQSHQQWSEQVLVALHSLTTKTNAEQLIDLWLDASTTIDFELVKTYRALFPQAQLVLTTNATDRLDADLKHCGLESAFDGIVNSANLGVAKPSAEYFMNAARLIETNPENILFIDDSKENVEAAMRCGFQTVHFEQRVQVLSELALLSMLGPCCQTV